METRADKVFSLNEVRRILREDEVKNYVFKNVYDAIKNKETE